VIELSDIEDPEVFALADEAREFLESQHWCERTGNGWLAFAVPGVLGVFLFDVRGNQRDVDPQVWVVVGDLPSAYIAQPADAGWQDVLSGYVYEMRRWVAAVEAEASVAELIPVDVAPTREHAAMLTRRLDFIQTELLDRSAEDIAGAV